MRADEAGTLARLKEYRRELIDPKNKQYRGRVVKATGDGILIEFPSVVDAISCSLEVQQGMRERNADIPPEKRIEFRIVINLGDVIVEGRDLYGDGVNIAARLEGLAEPGGISISQTVPNHARGKIAFEFEDPNGLVSRCVTRLKVRWQATAPAIRSLRGAGSRPCVYGALAELKKAWHQSLRKACEETPHNQQCKLLVGQKQVQLKKIRILRLGGVRHLIQRKVRVSDPEFREVRD